MHRNSADAHLAAGYVTDVAYPETFFRELSPVWLNYVATLGGIAPRDLDRPFTYLELGCGLGSSVITNAASFPGARFHACDINRAHVEHARERAVALGIYNIELHQCGFEALRQEALPAFDFIVAHGVYSWVSAHERQTLCDLIRERLKPGGLLYVSYNSLPGWAGEMPLRKLLVELADGEGDTTVRAGRALRLLQQIGAGRLKYMEANPACATAIHACTRAPIPYVAHEFLNATWEPFYCVDVADQLQQAGVAYAGSATLADNHAALLVDESTLRSIGQLPGERQRRLALDFATNQQFRRDVFWHPTSAGGTPTCPAPYLDASLIGCIDDPLQLPAQVRVPRGVVHFQPDFIHRLRVLLAHGPMAIGAAVGEIGGGNRTAADEIRRNLLYLVAAGALMPFSRPSAYTAPPAALSASGPMEQRCQPANGIVERALAYSIARQAPCVLPSEILGNGVRIGLAEAASVSRYLEGERAGPECVNLVRRLLRLGILKEGCQ